MSRRPPAGSLLAAPARVPLRPAAAAAELGPTLVVAPHPDDESLGCGGTIALLRDAGCTVHVLVVSDGAASHPGSRRYPPRALRALRQREARRALAILGVDSGAVTFLGQPDSAVPTVDAAGFADSVAGIRRALHAVGFRPSTVLLPWRRDPHCDHRAAWQLTHAALDARGWRPRRLEYPIWAWEAAEPDDAPRPDEASAWRLDVGRVLARKRAAIAAYRSQTTDLIDDDPTGFRLAAASLANFERPWELYLEVRR
jgi:LmbE family N-acetylglucosaminyl deacetylase